MKTYMIRKRIDRLLEKGINQSPIVVSGGAGFGKTQAVTCFLKRSRYRGVWFRLTQLDNLPVRFWDSFLYTVSLHRTELGKKLRRLGFPDSLYKFHKFLEILTDELYRDDHFVVFVFDDFHFIENESVLQFFRFLVSSKLENLCIIFITRKLESCLFHHNMYILSTEDMRFTQEEVIQYFKELNLPDSGHYYNWDELYANTSGWPMAVSLLSLQMKKHAEEAGKTPFNTQNLIFELIEKEVYSSYTEQEQHFFLTLPELNFFPRRFLQAIRHELEEDIDSILRNNIFVTYDPMGGRYYFHQIFLDFLKERKRTKQITGEADMIRKAAEWCRENEYYIDAMQYYHKCGMDEEVWNIILSLEGTRHSREEADDLLHYIKITPPGLMDDNPMRRVVYAMFLLNNLEMAEARRQLDLAYDQLVHEQETGPSGRGEHILGEVYTAYGLISLGLENLEFVEYFRQADRLLPEGSRRWGRSLRLVEYSNALNISSSRENVLPLCVDAFRQAMPHVSRVLHGAGYGLEYLAAAEAGFLTGDMKQAQKEAFKALYMAEEKEQYDIIDNSLFLLLRIFVLAGDMKGIKDILNRLEKGRESRDISAQDIPDLALSWFYSEIGEISKVAGFILYDAERIKPPISIDKESLLRIRCLIEQHNYYEALALLTRLERIYDKRNTLISMIYVHIYRAIVCYSTNDGDHAVRAVKKAYDLSAANHLIMPFIEYGHRTRAIFSYMQSMEEPPVPRDWLDMIHTKASTYAKRHPHIVESFSMKGQRAFPDYSLTKRETELLKNLSQGLTRDEIAGSMNVSPNTVKSMLKTVYNKMGAVNKADAVRIAMNARII